MKTRRFSITRDEAELTIAALEIIVAELERNAAELTIRELNQLAACRNLNRKLKSYQWEV